MEMDWWSPRPPVGCSTTFRGTDSIVYQAQTGFVKWISVRAFTYSQGTFM